MIGILTEKATARANFKKALGGETGTFNGEKYVLTNASGHLYSLITSPEKQVDSSLTKKYSSWNLDNLPWNYKDFKWKYSPTESGKKLLSNIKETLSKCDEIVIGTDIDPSGEGMLIASEIIFQLKLDKNKKISRMEFIDESPKSIQNAFINRREIKDLKEDSEYQKAYFRSRWDYMSMQFTRIATNLGKAPMGTPIRQGRLKSVMVKLVGEGLDSLQNYEEIPYFQNKFKDDNNVIYTNSKEPKYEKESEVPNIYKQSIVILDKKEIKETPPPKLIDLAGLSSMLAPKGITPKETLKTYQNMYQDGIVSYPRTEDKNITFEQFNEMLPLIDKIAKLVGVNSKILTHRKPRTTHVKNSGAHGANRPGLNIPESIESLNQKYGRASGIIYKTLALNFLAMFTENYKYERQTGHIKDYPNFKGGVNVPKELGWREVFDYDFEDDEQNAKGLGQIANPFIFKGFPPKPATPTMKWLMKLLDKNNVGSGSTKTSIYTDITNQDKKQLLIDTKGKVVLSPLGEISYKLLKNSKIGDIETTEKLQEAMKLVGLGNFEVIDKTLKEIENLVKLDIEIMTENSKDLEPIKKKEYKQVEKIEHKDENGKEVNFKKEWNGYTFTEDEIKLLKQGKEIKISSPTFKNKRGKRYDVIGKLEWQTFKSGKKTIEYYGFKVIEFVNI